MLESFLRVKIKVLRQEFVDNLGTIIEEVLVQFVGIVDQDIHGWLEVMDGFIVASAVLVEEGFGDVIAVPDIDFGTSKAFIAGDLVAEFLNFAECVFDVFVDEGDVVQDFSFIDEGNGWQFRGGGESFEDLLADGLQSLQGGVLQFFVQLFDTGNQCLFRYAAGALLHDGIGVGRTEASDEILERASADGGAELHGFHALFQGDVAVQSVLFQEGGLDGIHQMQALCLFRCGEEAFDIVPKTSLLDLSRRAGEIVGFVGVDVPNAV